jgi:hypothetical protein
MSKFQNGANRNRSPFYIHPLETKLFLCVPKLWSNLILQKIFNFESSQKDKMPLGKTIQINVI